MNRELLIGLVCGLLLGTGCATQGYRSYERPDFEGAQRDFDRAQTTIDNWLAPQKPAKKSQECVTREWKNIYGKYELRTDCD